MSVLSGIRWLFFDIGNTLVDESAPVADRLAKIAAALGKRGVAVSVDTVEQAFLDATATFDVKLMAAAVARLTDDPAIQEHVMKHTPWRKDLERPYPDALSALAVLAKRYRIGIIANQSPGTARRSGP